MLARGRLSKKIFFAYFVFRGSIGIYQSDQTSRIVKKIHKSMHPSAHGRGVSGRGAPGGGGAP
jgi:hypothetical protein